MCAEPCRKVFQIIDELTISFSVDPSGHHRLRSRSPPTFLRIQYVLHLSSLELRLIQQNSGLARLWRHKRNPNHNSQHLLWRRPPDHRWHRRILPRKHLPVPRVLRLRCSLLHVCIRLCPLVRCRCLECTHARKLLRAWTDVSSRIR